MRHLKLARIAGFLVLLMAVAAVSNANPLLDKTTPFPDFATITPADFAPALDSVLTDYNNTLKKILTTPPSWDNTIQPLEEAVNNVTRVWNIISHLNAATKSEQIKSSYAAQLPKITGFYSTIMYNSDLNKAFKTIKSSDEFAKLSREQQVLINQMLADFKYAGADLTADKKERYNKINARLQELSNNFESNLQAATSAWTYNIPPGEGSKLDGVPEPIKIAATQRAKAKGQTGWNLTLDLACLNAIETYAKNRDLRQTMYTSFSSIASDQDPDPTHKKWDNGPLIIEIVSLRQELARLLEYDNYAAYVLSDKEQPSTDKVMGFLGDLAKQSKTAAANELQNLTDFAKLKDNISSLEAWDIAYYTEYYKQSKYGISQDVMRQYFPEDQVFTGLFNTLSLVFGIQIQEIKKPSVWHPTVRLFELKDQTNTTRGYFYTDLYDRDLKNIDDQFQVLQSRLRLSDGTMQLPISFIQANFAANDQRLLTHGNVVNLFQECGHMLQQTLSLANYPSISGMNGMAWDASELNSHFMQEWTWQLQVVNDISKNINTGATLPEAIFNNLVAAKNFDSGLIMLKQLEFALFDFRLYLNLPADHNKNAMDLLTDIRQQISVVPSLKSDRFPNRFNHIFSGSFAAGYYGYQWAAMLGSDAFAAFQENGFFNPQIGRKYVQTILEQGGTKSTLDLFVDFRGRQPRLTPLLQQEGIATNSP
jgi:oligopeptidase A